MKITYSGFQSCAQDKRVRSLFKKYSNIIPKAINVLKVNFQNDEESNYCTCHYSKKYSNGIIDVHPLFFTLSEEEQELTVIHEIMHLWTGRISNQRHQLSEVIENKQLLNFINESFLCEEELFAETFAFFLHNLLEKKR